MNQKLLIFSVAAISLVSSGCGTLDFFAKAPELPPNAPIAGAGGDLQTAVAQATQAFIEAKNGDADFAWSVKKGLDAYQLFMKTKADVKVIVQQWNDGTKAGKSFADKLGSLFGYATGTPEEKAKALSAGVQVGAQASGVP